MNKDKPKVSAFMLMYGQIEKAEEALQSFLMQDYDGDKELIIFNDHPEQTIDFRHPQVKVFNSKKRMKSLEFKHSYAIGCCTGQMLIPWDSDDIFLPWAIRTRVARAKFGMGLHSLTWIPKDGELHLCRGFFHCNSIYSKDAVWMAGGYYPSDTEESFDWRVMRGMIENGCVLNDKVRPDYIYRICDGVHVSKLDLREEGLNERVSDALSGEPSGTFMLNPHWSKNWVAMSEEAEKKNVDPVYIWDIDPTIKNPNIKETGQENG